MNLLDQLSVMLFQGRHFNAEIVTLCVDFHRRRTDRGDNATLEDVGS